MLREAAEVTTATRPPAAAATKIRKRGVLSPSGASPEPQRRRRQRLRLRRGVRVIGRRRAAAASPGCPTKRRMSESSWNRRHCRHADAEETRSTSSASARKLVSALWQHDRGGARALEVEEEEGVGWDAAAARRRSDHRRSASLMELSKISRRNSKALKDEDGDDRSWHNGHAHGQWFSDVMSNGGTVEAHACTPLRPEADTMAQLQDLYHSLTASNELVRVLANVLGPAGALSATAASLLAALRSELDVARARARRLARQQQGRRGGGGGEGEGEGESVERVRRQLAEEVRAWKARHREKAAAAARLVASELEGERRSRRRAERVGKKLAEALAGAEGSLRSAERELERERAARERLQKLCDELSRSAGSVAGEEEEDMLRRAAESAREELEREREMLLLADELREERVRMKLAEARLQFEEKNAAVDRLRQELEAFLGGGKGRQESPDAHGERHRAVAVDDRRSLQLVLASEFGVDGIDRVATDNRQGRNDNGDADDGESEGSDIELNMDGNSWSYMATSSRETTVVQNNAASRSSQHGSFSDRGTEFGAVDRRSEGMGEAALEQEWDDDGCSADDDDGTTARDLDEDAERYEAIKNLREQMLAGNGFVFLSQGEADADKDRHRHGLMSQIENGGLW